MEERARPVLGTDLDHSLVFAGRRHHLLPFPQVVRERLLDIDVLARPAGPDRRQGMPVVRQGDDHRVDALVVEDSAWVVIRGDLLPVVAGRFDFAIQVRLVGVADATIFTPEISRSRPINWWPRPPTPPTAVVDPRPMTATFTVSLGLPARARPRTSVAASPVPDRPSLNLSKSFGVGSVSYHYSPWKSGECLGGNGRARRREPTEPAWSQSVDPQLRAYLLRLHSSSHYPTSSDHDVNRLVAGTSLRFADRA